jgi:hypothetical protein
VPEYIRTLDSTALHVRFIEIGGNRVLKITYGDKGRVDLTERDHLVGSIMVEGARIS